MTGPQIKNDIEAVLGGLIIAQEQLGTALGNYRAGCGIEAIMCIVIRSRETADLASQLADLLCELAGAHNAHLTEMLH